MICLVGMRMANCGDKLVPYAQNSGDVKVQLLPLGCLHPISLSGGFGRGQVASWRAVSIARQAAKLDRICVFRNQG